MRVIAGLLLVSFCCTTPMKFLKKKKGKHPKKNKVMEPKEGDSFCMFGSNPFYKIEKRFDRTIFGWDEALTKYRVSKEFVRRLILEQTIFNEFNEKRKKEEKKKLFSVPLLILVIKKIKNSNNKGKEGLYKSLDCGLKYYGRNLDVFWKEYERLAKQGGKCSSKKMYIYCYSPKKKFGIKTGKKRVTHKLYHEENDLVDKFWKNDRCKSKDDYESLKEAVKSLKKK